MRTLCFLLWTATALYAQLIPGQITGLATTGNGSVVYFSTAMRLRNTDTPLINKIFAADAQGVRVIAIQEGAGLSQPSVSGDGLVLSFDERPLCDQGMGTI